ncbi:PREDICTED: uncharacterized protein LOC109581304 [Amphimedon queenslandica]|nr:PREDICTED: uncharacterized protein LOC109581304 [Amphimedon queenslandica]|eukprot:XP_019850876.1 PREDICTED: uncharacterized protein LOC109581304 [Amphimedon queenslandica]
MYYKIMKPPADSASGCISTLPNGVYSISVLDALSYEEGTFNNTAIDILLLITINNTMFVIPSTTSMTTRSIISFKIPSRSMTTTNENSWTSFIPSPLLITSSSYDDNISMATSGPPVLIVALTGSAAFMMIMITIVVIISVGLCVAKKRKRSIAIHGIKKDGNATPCHTPVTNRFMVKEGIQCKTTFNEAYDNVTQANVVYETIPEKVQYVSGSAAGGLQINVAYDCIGGLRANH